MLSVYCDGASGAGPGRPGGYGWVIVKDDEILLWGFGGSPSTSNNKMELSGAAAGLEALLSSGLDQGNAVELCSDSQYVLGIITGAYSAVKNLEQVGAVRDLASRVKNLQCRWCKGHSGIYFNEVADMLASRGKLENTPLGLRTTQKIKGLARKERRRGVKQIPNS